MKEGLPFSRCRRFRSDFSVRTAMRSLTHTGLRADEAAAFRDHVSVVALAGKNLQHLRNLLLAARFSAPVHAEPDVGPFAGELPPGRERRVSVKAFCAVGLRRRLQRGRNGRLMERRAADGSSFYGRPLHAQQRALKQPLLTKRASQVFVF